MQSFFCPLPRGGGHSRREEEQGDRDTYIIRCGQIERTHTGTKTSHITYIDNTITLYIN